ncbi:helix-turn-helix domain-containing protein [Spirosoma sp. HMF4905]|uniref:Helix-turn-helix domain-containing protein n=1 Tax=Spirosoma arboris TaxID=2682092 RepID=A0A7K1S5Y4_9BACT|nr:AraC family transcriptional regulator [Spirosoma arboris]MVM29204.1 helix-turn-helix domain-containing protein [Spirosoma arboris]
MKALLEKTLLREEKSVLARRFTVPYFSSPFHFHPEYELTYIIRGSGKRFVGASIDNFEKGDLILLGSNLPHFWRSDAEYYQDQGLQCEAIVIHFSDQFVEQIIQKIPEFRLVMNLLTQSVHGIQFLASQPLADRLEQLVSTKKVKQVCDFLELLDALANHTTIRLLNTSAGYSQAKETENDRMLRTLEFTLANFQRTINLGEVADLANLTITSFCRYFRKYTGKTYIDYLNEIRISHARKLLIDSVLTIQEIGLISGFQNMSNFHRLFKLQTGLSPLAYRKIADTTS